MKEERKREEKKNLAAIARSSAGEDFVCTDGSLPLMV